MMRETDRDTLRKHRERLQKDLGSSEVDRIASGLYSKKIFSVEDKDEVTAKSTGFAKSDLLLDKLPRKGHDAFGVFCEVLRGVSPHLEELLRPSQEDGRASEGVDAKAPAAKTVGDEKPPVQEGSEKATGDQADARWFSSGAGVPSGKATSPVELGTTYKMEKNPRGLAVIINNKHFLPASGMQKYPRNGTDVDRDGLKRVFKKLLFKVEDHNDVRCFDMRRILKELATRDHSLYDAVIVAILTHGEEGIIYGTDGTLNIREITSWFTGPNLAGKPKLFFFQACQGHEYMDGTEVVDGPGQAKRVAVPTEADFLYAYSTVPGYYSWRNSQNGSWFIQSVVDVFDKHSEYMDVQRMMTRVNAGVSIFKSRTGDSYSDQKMQISSIVSMLRKDLYFFPEKVIEQN